MKPGIHPKYQEATVTCSCGNTWQTRSTRPQMRIELCNQCHPFYTGEQRIVDSAGQVERFMRRVEAAAGSTRTSKRQTRLAARAERDAQARRGATDTDETVESEETSDEASTAPAEPVAAS